MAAFHYPRFFAHRGGGSLAPENTLTGIALAARLGYRAVEFDAMLSSDGVPVLIHDETLQRTTNGRGEVAGTAFADLRALDAGCRFHPAFTGTPLPTLAEALDLCARLNLAANVEIKPAAGLEVETAAAVAGLAAEHEAVLLSSFAPAALAAARMVAPQLARALLCEEVPDNWQERLAALDCLALHCAARCVTPQLAAELAAAHIPWACYTVNHPEAAERLFALGASALFTDRLDLFADARIAVS